ncbi:hypothetical protein [Ideonella paludis]|uniref:hypothetical protein n=1 Tax=Ideonella paludis TaxID=1233411 RepID=UPI003632DA44
MAGAKVGHAGAVFIGLCVAAPLWMMLFKGAHDESSWVLGSLLIPFAPLLQSALLGGQLVPTLRRPETQHWARRGWRRWLLAWALPWWVALVIPAAFLSQAHHGVTVWIWFSALLAFSMAAGLSLAWTRWVVSALFGAVLLASWSSQQWLFSDLAAWMQGVNAPSVMLVISAILILASAALIRKTGQVLIGAPLKADSLSLTDLLASPSHLLARDKPEQRQLRSLIEAPPTPVDRWLQRIIPLPLFIGSAMVSRWLWPGFNESLVPILVALIPANLFDLNRMDGRVMPPPRGLLLPRGLHRSTLLREALWLYGTCPTTWGSATSKACVTFGFAWGMHWTLMDTLSLFAAIAASLLVELSLVAIRQRHSVRGALWVVAVGLMLGLFVGGLKGAAELLQLDIVAVILLASGLVALLAVVVIASQTSRWRRLTL